MKFIFCLIFTILLSKITLSLEITVPIKIYEPLSKTISTPIPGSSNIVINKEDIEKYKGRYSKGWDALRQERYKRMTQLGIITKDMPLSPRNAKVPRWEDAKAPQWQQRRMEVYAAQIDRMDQGIGRITESLKKSGRYENTVIMFLIDNGGCHVEYTTTRKGPYLPEKTRGGKPVKAGNINGLMPGPENTYQSYGYGWANASNTPFRLYKQFCHEGGIRTPLIVHWPAGLKTKPGSITREVGLSLIHI